MPTSAGQALLAKFKGVVATPTDAETYNISRWATNAERRAAYVFYPTDADDISVAVLFAQAEKLAVAVHGGGHNSQGSSSSEGGVVVDMRKMNGVRVDKEKMIGCIQGGATIWHTTEELYKHELTTTLGTCGSVGVIGATVGGGTGFSMGRYGLAIDNVDSATVVLATGEIVTASERENPDLFWGIRGGGSNFGIIAELAMRLFKPRPDVAFIECIYLPGQMESVVTALNEWKKEQGPEETIFFVVGLGPHDGKPYLILTGLAEIDSNEAQRRWERFLKIGPAVAKAEQIPYPKLCQVFNSFCHTPGTKVYGGAYCNSFDYEMLKKAYDIWLPVTEKAPTSALLFEFYPYDKAASVPVEATASPQRSTDMIVMVGVQGFTDMTFNTEAHEILKSLRNAVSSSSTESAKNSVGYLNYTDVIAADQETDDSARRAYGPNYPRLQALKRKYDPNMVFHKWLRIKPAE